MKKLDKTGLFLLTAGVVLVLAALLLFSHNRIEDKKAGENAKKTLQQLEDAMTEREAKDETDATPAPDVSSSPGMPSPAGTGSGSNGLPAPPALDMPTVHSGAYDYIGYLDFPGYGLTMPVAATWSFPALEISPCRHTGSVYNDNLVVAGHNYNTHFGVLFELQLGDIVTFTDVDGNAFTYTVRELTSVSPDNSDAVMNRGYALTLYTCNWDTTERVTVFCERDNGEV